jgi:hypothetical protein
MTRVTRTGIERAAATLSAIRGRGHGKLEAVIRGPGVMILCALASALPALAHADPRIDRDPMKLTEVPRKLERTYSEQIADRLTWLGTEMDHHVGRLSFDRLAIRFDGRARRARIRVGKGDGGAVSLRIDGDVVFDHGLARVDTRIGLSIAGQHMQFVLPKIELVPSSWNGEKYVEVRVPLIEGSFEPETWFH